MPETNRLSTVAQDVRRYDRDRFGTVLFAPTAHREALLTLFAFNLELARVREQVSEPMLGQIRLQWWRDTIDQLFEKGAPTGQSHPVAQDLALVIRQRGLSRSPFDRLIDSRETDLDDEPLADMTALEDYAEGTSSTLNYLSLEVLGLGEHDDAMRAARHVGIAWALTGLLRALPFHAAAGRVMMPSALLQAAGVSREELLRGETSPNLKTMTRDVAQRIRDHLARARQYRDTLPKAALAALLTAPLADAYLARLARVDHDPMNTTWSLTRPHVARLAVHAMIKRY